ncbi:MAG: hypothetical protein ABH839_00250 [Chloroflexota bacterium]
MRERQVKVMLVLKISGKARQVFALLALLARERGGDTLAEIMQGARRH